MLMPAPPNALLMPRDVGDWGCVDLELRGPHELRARFANPELGAWLDISILPVDTPGAVLRRLTRCAVRYQGHIPDTAPTLKQSAGVLIRDLAEGVERVLLASPDASLREALSGGARLQRLEFSRQGLRDLLEPWLGSTSILGPWVLRDVYPSSQLQVADRDKLELVLDLEGPDGERVRFVVGPADPRLPSFRETQHFRLQVLETGTKPGPAARTVASLVAFALQLADSDQLEVDFPGVGSDVAQRLLVAPAASSEGRQRTLNLAVSADCDQACTFCSIRDLRPPLTFEDRHQVMLVADLTASRAAGVERVRLNGYDPLAWPGVLDLVQHARDLGYTFMEVFSPCTRLADREFTAALLERMPAQRRFVVPVYGASAATHDAVVGREGAFAEVESAVGVLVELGGSDCVALSTVVTPGNLDDLVPMVVAWAERGHHLSLHLAFASSEDVDDAWRRVAMPQAQIAATLAAGVAALPRDSAARYWGVRGLAPCFQYRAFAERGLPVGSWLVSPLGLPRLPGTEYRAAEYVQRGPNAEHDATIASTVPCPHEERCALRQACPREFLRSYVDVIGIDDVSPVGLAELLALPSIPSA